MTDVQEQTERCDICRAPVVREGDRVQFDSSRYHMDAVKKLSEISALRGAIESQQARIEELEVEVSDLQAFYESVRGWRENDWPSSFCRATAERLSQHGTHAAMQSALRRIGSPAVTDNQVTGQPLAALQTDKDEKGQTP